MHAMACLLMVSVVNSALAAPQTDKNGNLAWDAAAAFLKAVKAKNLDTLITTVGTPFLYYEDGADAKRPPVIVSDPAKLKAWFKDVLDLVKDTSTVNTEIKSVVPLVKARETIKDPKKLAAFEQVIGKGAGFVAVTGDGTNVLIRVLDGQAKVVWFEP